MSPLLSFVISFEEMLARMSVRFSIFQLTLSKKDSNELLDEINEMGEESRKTSLDIELLITALELDPEQTRALRKLSTALDHSTMQPELMNELILDATTEIRLVKRDLITKEPDESAEADDPSKTNSAWLFRDNGRPDGDFLTANYLHERYGINNSRLTRELGSDEHRIKHPNGRGFVYKWSSVKILADAKFADETEI